jgi:hypothetical protein
LTAAGAHDQVQQSAPPVRGGEQAIALCEATLGVASAAASTGRDGVAQGAAIASPQGGGGEAQVLASLDVVSAEHCP